METTNKIATYRKKPIIKTAIEFFPAIGQIPSGVISSERADPRKDPYASWIIPTSWGTLYPQDGDYIVMKKDGERLTADYSCDRKIWLDTHEYISSNEWQTKPVEVKVIQYTESNFNTVFNFVREVVVNHEEVASEWKRFFIRTKEGQEKVDVGDFIVQGVQGEFYPMSKESFAERYELAESFDELRDKHFNR